MTTEIRPHRLVRRAFRKQSGSPECPCSVEQFCALIEYERQRSDRSGSPFALVLLTLSQTQYPKEDGFLLASLLDRRLRMTDEIGWWNGQTVGLLLTDTGELGAKRVLDDILHLLRERFPLSCSISIYPSNDDEPGNDSDASQRESVAVEAENEIADGPPVRQVMALPTPFWKRTMDILGSLIGLIALSPVFFLVALLVKLTSPGPVLFRQERVGRGGQPFTILKFRTMRVDAERRKGELLDLSEQDGPAFKLRNDPRVTWLGRYLRRSCIDELPQLWHVLRGQMSLVGPRPLDCAEAKFCETWQRRRYIVAPGLTCIWQVHGKSQVSFEEWMRMDLRYVESRSFWKDIKLIGATLIAVVLHRASH